MWPGGVAMESEPGDETTIARVDAARVVNRLARVEGQVRGLQRMIDEGKDCEAVLTQLAAVKSALDRVGVLLISQRMRECLESSVGAEVPPAALEEAFDVFLKYVQCVR
jgi:DNA-binding FrmR family transcriptional regulator